MSGCNLGRDFFPSSTSDKNKFPKFASNWLSNWELPFEQNIMENSLFTSFSACHLSNKSPSKEDKSEKSHSHIQTHHKKRELMIEAWFIYFVTKCFIFFHPSMGLRMCVCVCAWGLVFPYRKSIPQTHTHRFLERESFWETGLKEGTLTLIIVPPWWQIGFGA